MAGVLVPATISERSNANTPKLTVKTHAFVTQVLFESEKRLMDYKVIGLNILKANTCIGQIPEPLKPVTMQLLSIRFTSSELSLAVQHAPVT